MFRKFFVQPEPVVEPPKVVDLKQEYISLTQSRQLQVDDNQLDVIKHMQVLMDTVLWQEKCQEHPEMVGRLLATTPVAASKHLYLFGGVGQGKSMLMDLFFASCPVRRKRRVHFHSFMQEVHAYIHREEKNSRIDVMLALAKQIRHQSLLLCFDEFHAMDIVDAKIIERLFRILFKLGIVSIMTSNRHPEELYRGGLLKEQYQPFVEMLLRSCNIVQLSGTVDYRTVQSPHQEVRYFVTTDRESSMRFVKDSFFQYTQTASLQPGYIAIFGRQIALSAVHGDTVLTTFDELCGQPLAAPDYIQIATRFKTVIMADIPQLSANARNEAKRLSLLIDVLYEYRVKFICSAAIEPAKLYVKGKGAFEFQRTISRLTEMQSANYAQ